MATILVDYENVYNSDGLKGVEYLNDADTLCIFFNSNTCGKIRCDYMEIIEKSGCSFRTYKLVKKGKNALDFYIASECGALRQSGEKQIAIVSKDKGFSAVSDFFRIKEGVEEPGIVTASNIEKALIHLSDDGNADRRKILQHNMKMLDLETSQARIEERMRLRKKLKEALIDTGYEFMYDRILSYIEDNRESTPKVLYTGALHQFGREDGMRIYRILKNVA